MLSAQAALSEARDALRRDVLAQPEVLRNTIEQARAAEENMGTATREQEKAALALNKAAIGYQELARQAETDRALYESVLRQIKETNLTKNVKTNAVSVIEHSPYPNSPVSPNSRKAIVLGLLGGLAAALAFVYLADVLDRSIKTVDQAESLLGLPVLAAVPEAGNDSKVPVAEAQYQPYRHCYVSARGRSARRSHRGSIPKLARQPLPAWTGIRKKSIPLHQCSAIGR